MPHFYLQIDDKEKFYGMGAKDQVKDTTRQKCAKQAKEVEKNDSGDRQALR